MAQKTGVRPDSQIKHIFWTLFITWFGCGRAPFASGTVGSIGAVPLCWILASSGDLFLQVSFAIGMTCLAIFGSAYDQRVSNSRDPGYIVVDEVAGMLWSTIAVPAAPVPFLFAFVVFRILDVLKPFPASFFDRASKTAKTPFQRGAHIVLDDVVAGIFTALLYIVARKYLAPDLLTQAVSVAYQ